MSSIILRQFCMSMMCWMPECDVQSSSKAVLRISCSFQPDFKGDAYWPLTVRSSMLESP